MNVFGWDCPAWSFFYGIGIKIVICLCPFFPFILLPFVLKSWMPFHFAANARIPLSHFRHPFWVIFVPIFALQKVLFWCWGLIRGGINGIEHWMGKGNPWMVALGGGIPSQSFIIFPLYLYSAVHALLSAKTGVHSFIGIRKCGKWQMGQCILKYFLNLSNLMN